MRPLALSERGLAAPTVSLASLLQGGRPTLSGACPTRLEDYVGEIVASGFPGLRSSSGRARRGHLDGYLRHIVDRDFEELGHNVRDPAALRRWMTAYAAASSTTASFETIRDAATGGHGEKPAKTTTLPYRDVLADPALAARLLGIDAGALLEGRAAGPPVPRDGTLLGALFESLATLSVRTYAQAAEAAVKHLRTVGGRREVDLIVERADGRVVAVEVKLTRDVKDRDTAHLRWRADGIGVVPAALLGP